MLPTNSFYYYCIFFCCRSAARADFIICLEATIFNFTMSRDVAITQSFIILHRCTRACSLSLIHAAALRLNFPSHSQSPWIRLYCYFYEMLTDSTMDFRTQFDVFHWKRIFAERIRVNQSEADRRCRLISWTHDRTNLIDGKKGRRKKKHEINWKASNRREYWIAEIVWKATQQFNWSGHRAEQPKESILYSIQFRLIE